MGRTVRLETAVNGAFLTRRWEEPENWMRLTREVGFRNHSFCADVLDPFFSGDREYQIATALEVREAAARHGVTICDVYTGVATHRFHGLSHSNESCRRRMMEWIAQCSELAVTMGAPRLGGHWDALSCEVLADEARTREALKRLYGIFRELAVVASDRGLSALYNEQMYIPSEVPWTLAQAEEFLLEVNRGTNGVPVRLTLDVGHQAGMHYGLSGADLDYVEWVRRFGAFTELVHIQQTTLEHSAHWPFTPEYNARGHIRVEAVIEALEWSHAHASESPVAEVLDPVETCYLVAEIIPGSTKVEDVLLGELSQTAAHLDGFLPGGVLEIAL